MPLLLRLWRDYAHRHRWSYLAGFLCLLATNALAVAIPGLVQHAVDALAAGLGAGGVFPFALALVGAGVGTAAVRTLSRTLFFNPGRTVEFDLKGDLFDRLLVLPRGYFDRVSAGDLVSRGTNDMNAMRALVGFSSLQAFNVVLVLTLTLGRMAQTSGLLTLVCVLPLTLAAFILGKAIQRMFSLFGQVQAQLSTLSDRILEGYAGSAVLTAYGALPGALKRFDEANERLLSLSERLLVIRSWLLPIVSVAGNLCLVAVLFVGGRQVIDGGLSVGALAAFLVYVNVLVGGLTSLGWLLGAVQRGYVALQRLYEVIDAEDERPPVTAALPEPGPEGHSLKVQDLSFTYPGASEPALSHLSLEVHPGEVVGIFGLTGSGKSTLLNLVARVYEPPPGAVSLSGVDVRALPITDYWASLAYVGQEAHLFSQTLRENIALADEPAETSEARLAEAVADAALDTDLHSLPQGLDTLVGERGVTLSGGQRQRTSLARTFYRPYRALLLDDVLSAVDHATEKRLIDALYRRGQGSPTLLVSHRVSVLARADRILVLDGGRVVDEGTHEALLSRDGAYAKAFKLQQAVSRLSDLPEEVTHG